MLFLNLLRVSLISSLIMPHILASLKGMNAEDIKKIKIDAPRHPERELYLEHFWQNVDDLEEVVFLFQTGNIRKAKEFINRSSHRSACKKSLC
jgi:hypothetical protein